MTAKRYFFLTRMGTLFLIIFLGVSGFTVMALPQGKQWQTVIAYLLNCDMVITLSVTITNKSLFYQICVTGIVQLLQSCKKYICLRNLKICQAQCHVKFKFPLQLSRQSCCLESLLGCDYISWEKWPNSFVLPTCGTDRRYIMYKQEESTWNQIFLVPFRVSIMWKWIRY